MNVPLKKAANTVLCAGGAAVFAATAFSQHPNRVFDRFRTFDKIGFWLPNWRFFAPEPAMLDFHILHRTLDLDEIESPWEETHTAEERRASHLFWFPQRRVDKGIFDVASELAGTLSQPEETVLSGTSYRVLAEFVRHRISTRTSRPLAGYQFLIARGAGYDETVPPEELLISPFIPWKEPTSRETY